VLDADDRGIARIDAFFDPGQVAPFAPPAGLAG